MTEAQKRMVCPDCGLHYRRVDDAAEPGRCLRCQVVLIPLPATRHLRMGLPPLHDASGVKETG
jgi:hypothetical protein